MSLAHISAQLMADRYHDVKVETWGHLAPEKNIKYPIEFIVAVGYFSEDVLNPVLLSVANEGPWYGPWFYENVREFLSNKLGNEANEGKLFRFVGHWRNYKFVGKFKEVRLA